MMCSFMGENHNFGKNPSAHLTLNMSSRLHTKPGNHRPVITHKGANLNLNFDGCGNIDPQPYRQYTGL